MTIFQYALLRVLRQLYDKRKTAELTQGEAHFVKSVEREMLEWKLHADSAP